MFYTKLLNHYYDVTGEIMGSLPEEEIIPFLQEALRGEYQQWDLYYSYKDKIKSLARDSIAKHFEEHAEDEADHIELLQRHIMALGADPTLDRHPIPKLDTFDASAIIELQIKFEQKAVIFYQKILDLLGEDYTALRIDIENTLAKEQEHYHDLQFLLQNK